MDEGLRNIQATVPCLPQASDSDAAAFSPAASATAASSAAIPYDHLHARGEPQLTLDYDRFTGLQSVIHHHVLVDTRAGGDVSRFHRSVRLHHVDKRAALAGLDRL